MARLQSRSVATRSQTPRSSGPNACHEADFGGKVGVRDFLHDYLADDTARRWLRREGAKVKFGYLDYDWNLNM